MEAYKPEVGDCVDARRRNPSETSYNLVVGPVTEVREHWCRIITNRGTDIEGDFQLSYEHWKFRFLWKEADMPQESDIV